MLLELLVIMVDSSAITQPANDTTLNETETTTLAPISNSTTEIYDSPLCMEKSENEKPQDLATLLMKNYSRYSLNIESFRTFTAAKL